MAASQFKLSLIIGAALQSGFKTTIDGTQNTFSKLGATLDNLKDQQKAIEKFSLARDENSKISAEYRDAKRELTKLRIEYELADNPSKKLAKNFEKAQKNVERLSQKLERNKTTLEQARNKLKSFGLSTSNLISDNKRLGASIDKLSVKYTKLGKAIRAQEANRARQDKAKSQVMGAVAVGASIAAPLNTAIDFEESIVKLGAISGAEGNVLEKLSNKARKLGQETFFTASESANAMNMLARSGFKTNEIMTATGDVLNLAQSAGVGLAESAGISSDILRGFGLEAKEMQRVTDALVGTFTSSGTTLESLGETMKFVGPVASSVGGDIEQVAAMAGLLGDAGIRGSLAGTALRTSFSRLAAEPGKVKTALSAMNIEADDGAGNLKKMPEILKELAKETSEMGTKERAKAITEIFGLEASSAMSKLIEQVGKIDSESGLNNLEKKIKLLRDKEVTAQEIAEKMGKTTRGSLKRLGSALESVAISVGSLLLPTIAAGADLFAKVASWISRTADEFPLLTKVVVGAAVGLAALHISVIGGTLAFTFFKGALLSAKAVIAAVSAAQTLLNVTMTAFPLGTIIVGMAALVGAGLWLVANWDTVKIWIADFWEGLKTVTKNTIGWIVDNIGSLLHPFGLLGKAISFVSDKLSGNKISVEGNAKLNGVDNTIGAAINNTSALSSPLSNTALPSDIQPASVNNSQTFTTQANINVVATPEMDEKAVAKVVAKELEQQSAQARASQRANLYDGIN